MSLRHKECLSFSLLYPILYCTVHCTVQCTVHWCIPGVHHVRYCTFSVNTKYRNNEYSVILSQLFANICENLKNQNMFFMN